MDYKEKIPCSVAILTLNCCGELKRCLETLRDFEEIVVLDGNSTDGTPELAREFGAKVYPQVETEEKNVRIKNFPAMRMKSFRACSADWIFEMDADEYIGPELAGEIREFIKKNNLQSAAMVPRLAIIDNKIIKHAFFYPNDYIRIFHKNSGICYDEKKVVHEELVVPSGISVVKFGNATLAPWPPYPESIKKDNGYLKMAIGRSIDENDIYKKDINKIFIKKIFRKSVKNFLKALKISVKSLFIYFKYGFRRSLPPKQVWRFVRYHLLFSFLLSKSLFLSILKRYR